MEQRQLGISVREKELIETSLLIRCSFRLWMLPETDADTQEFLLQAGFAEGYPKNDASQTVDLKRLLDETKDYIDRYTLYLARIWIYANSSTY